MRKDKGMHTKFYFVFLRMILVIDCKKDGYLPITSGMKLGSRHYRYRGNHF